MDLQNHWSFKELKKRVHCFVLFLGVWYLWKCFISLETSICYGKLWHDRAVSILRKLQSECVHVAFECWPKRGAVYWWMNRFAGSAPLERGIPTDTTFHWKLVFLYRAIHGWVPGRTLDITFQRFPRDSVPQAKKVTLTAKLF